MGLAICNKHGQTGVVSNISLDICKELSDNHNNEIREIVVVIIDVYDNDEFLYKQKNYISRDIFNKYNLKKSYKISTEEEEKDINKIFPKTSGLCSKCFEEYIEKNDILLER